MKPIRKTFLALAAGLCVLGTGCGPAKTGLAQPGEMNVTVRREPHSLGLKALPATPAVSKNGLAQPILSPDAARIAFTRIWYPSLATLQAIMEDADNKRMGDFTAIANPSDYAAGCIQTLDRDPGDPLVFDLEASDEWWESEAMPLAETYYPGVVIAALYYEFDISDFTIRWYLSADADYQREDILVKTGAEVAGGTGGAFKFAYVSQTTGKVEFFDARQTTGFGTGLNSIVSSEKWGKWADPYDMSGLLPDGTHAILHGGDLEYFDLAGAIYYEEGDAPEVIDYIIRYNLSVDEEGHGGGVQYFATMDVDSDGAIECSDLLAEPGPRDFDLTPITGAIEYSPSGPDLFGE